MSCLGIFFSNWTLLSVGSKLETGQYSGLFRGLHMIPSAQNLIRCNSPLTLDLHLLINIHLGYVFSIICWFYFIIFMCVYILENLYCMRFTYFPGNSLKFQSCLDIFPRSLHLPWLLIPHSGITTCPSINSIFISKGKLSITCSPTLYT